MDLAPSADVGDGFRQLEVSPDARFVVARSRMGQISVWSAQTLKRLHVLEVGGVDDHFGFSPDGRFGFIALDRHLALVDFSRDPVQEHDLNPTPCKRAKAAAFSADGTALAVGSEYSVCLFGAATRQFLGQPVAGKSEPDREFLMEWGYSNTAYPQFVAGGRGLFVVDALANAATFRVATGERVDTLTMDFNQGLVPSAAVDANGATYLVFGETVYVIDPALHVSIKTLPELRDVLSALRPDLYFRYDARELLGRLLCFSLHDERARVEPCPGVEPVWIP